MMKNLHVKTAAIITACIFVYIFYNIKHLKTVTKQDNSKAAETALTTGVLSTTKEFRDNHFCSFSILSPSSSTLTAYSSQPAVQQLYVLVQAKDFVIRFGNQMFIYAALLGIARRQNRVPLLEDGKDVAKAFEISIDIRKINSTDWEKLYQQRGIGIFEPKFMNLPKKNVMLSGALQSWRFFIDIQDEIRREFTFRPIIQQKTTRFYNKLRENNTDTVFVGVHVRRTDFVSPSLLKHGFNSPDVSYFMKAFNYMRNIVSNNTLFLVASDDMEWCRVNLNYTDVKLLEPDSPENHMSILSSSDHVIITSGTFGWWCAWLAKGLKVYYKGFPSPGSNLSNLFKPKDYYPPGWIGFYN